MRKTFLISVSAAALIAASGCALAQGPNTQSAPIGQSAQGSPQNAPAAKIAPTMNRSETDTKAKVGGKTTGQAEQKSPGDLAAPKRAEGDVKKDDTRAKATQAKPTENKLDMKPNDKAASEMNADKSKAEMKGNPKAAGDVKAGATTGQAAAGSKQLTVDQRATIRTVVKEQKVQPATNVNFAVTVGTVVPRNIKFYPVPAEFVTIDREWRGFEYFLVGDRIVIVNPRTLEIVAVVEA